MITPLLVFSAQCYAKCYMEKHEMFEEDGSINAEKAFECYSQKNENQAVEHLKEKVE